MSRNCHRCRTAGATLLVLHDEKPLENVQSCTGCWDEYEKQRPVWIADGAQLFCSYCNKDVDTAHLSVIPLPETTLEI